MELVVGYKGSAEDRPQDAKAPLWNQGTTK